MRRILIVFASLAAMLGLAAAALAASPHFVTGPTATQGTNSVTVTGKVAGLGNVTEATFTLSGSASATYGCFNKGGNHPSATNKEGPTDVSATGTFPVRNGSTTASLTIFLPASTLSCPSGQHTELMSGEITGLTFSGAGIGTVAVEGDFIF